MGTLPCTYMIHFNITAVWRENPVWTLCFSLWCLLAWRREWKKPDNEDETIHNFLTNFFYYDCHVAAAFLLLNSFIWGWLWLWWWVWPRRTRCFLFSAQSPVPFFVDLISFSLCVHFTLLVHLCCCWSISSSFSALFYNFPIVLHH